MKTKPGDPECSGPCANISATCDCGCGVYGTGVHIVRTLREGHYGEMVSTAKVYAGKCCPACHPGERKGEIVR